MFKDLAQARLAIRVLRLVCYSREKVRHSGGLKGSELIERVGANDANAVLELEEVVKLLRSNHMLGARDRRYVITQEGVDFLLKNDKSAGF